MVNPPAALHHQLRQFVQDYFATLGAAISAEGGILRVELNPDQLAELEGRTGPRMSFFGCLEEGTTVLYFAFDQDTAAAVPNAELVAPGSHRLEQMYASALRQGRIGLFTLVPRGALEPLDELHTPYLLLHFRIAYEGRCQSEQLIPVCVNLCNGDEHPAIARQAENAELAETLPRRVAMRKLGFGDAWKVACKAVVERLRTQDDGWAREALLALAQEKRFLEQFYAQQCADEADDLAAERAERLAEADRRSRPRAIARTTLAAVLMAPASF